MKNPKHKFQVSLNILKTEYANQDFFFRFQKSTKIWNFSLSFTVYEIPLWKTETESLCIQLTTHNCSYFSIAQCTVMSECVLASSTRSEGRMQIMLRSHVPAFAKNAAWIAIEVFKTAKKRSWVLYKQKYFVYSTLRYLLRRIFRSYG